MPKKRERPSYPIKLTMSDERPDFYDFITEYDGNKAGRIMAYAIKGYDYSRMTDAGMVEAITNFLKGATSMTSSPINPERKDKKEVPKITFSGQSG